MNVLIVMDRNGDSRFEFDATDAAAVQDAQQRFNDLMRQGYRPVALRESGGELLRSFDEKAEQTLFIPHLVGG